MCTYVCACIYAYTYVHTYVCACVCARCAVSCSPCLKGVVAQEKLPGTQKILCKRALTEFFVNET